MKRLRKNDDYTAKWAKHGGYPFLKTYDSYDTHGHLYLILIAWERGK
jgi:hypothetical protein